MLNSVRGKQAKGAIAAVNFTSAAVSLSRAFGQSAATFPISQGNQQCVAINIYKNLQRAKLLYCIPK
jgi:hypothetical protein